MKSTNKGIQSYVAIILVISVIMSILIMSILSSFFVNDPEKCKLIEYEITKSCGGLGSVTLTIKNINNNKLYLKINEQDGFNIAPTTSEVLTYKGSENSVLVIPYFTDIKGQIAECKGGTNKIDMNMLRKC